MKIALRIVLVLVLVLAVLFLLASNGLKDIQAMTINSVDLSGIDDGTYAGNFQKTRWKYDVEVSVENHRIVTITCTNKLSGFNKSTAEDAAEAMIKKQDLIIDAVSGASVNTKAFQKAVENALTGGKKR